MADGGAGVAEVVRRQRAEKIRSALANVKECGALVDTRGLLGECGGEPVALRYERVFGRMSPVCAMHVDGELVPLREVVAAVSAVARGGLSSF